jgi:hypothetical protein
MPRAARIVSLSMPYHISRENHRDRVSEQKEDSGKYLEIGVEGFQEEVGK